MPNKKGKKPYLEFKRGRTDNMKKGGSMAQEQCLKLLRNSSRA